MGEPVVTLSLSTAVVLILGVVNLVVLGPVAWIVRGHDSALKEIAKDISDTRDEAAKEIAALRDLMHREYVHENLYQRDIQEIKSMLTSIHEKLDRKADKV